MKTKTMELTGAALDYAVAMCEGASPLQHDGITRYFTMDGRLHVLQNGWGDMTYQPSRLWTYGGPIIEREKIGVVTSSDDANVWVGSIFESEWRFNRTGPTPLIAAMRCYVASKLGDEVDIPEELT